MRIEWDPGTGKEYVQIVMQQNVDIAIVDTTFHGRSCYTHDDGVFEICHDDLQSLPTGYYDLTLTRGHAASGMSPIPTPWLGTAKSSHTITVYLR